MSVHATNLAHAPLRERRSAALPEAAPGRHQVLQPERRGHAVDDDLRRGRRATEDAAEQITGDQGDEEKPARGLHLIEQFRIDVAQDPVIGP